MDVSNVHWLKPLADGELMMGSDPQHPNPLIDLNLPRKRESDTGHLLM